MFDKKAFEIMLLEMDMNKKDLAQNLGINVISLYRRINQETDFTYHDLQVICALFGKEKMISIFFANKVT